MKIGRKPRLTKDKRYYLIGGETYPRLSEVVSIEPNPGLRAWQKKVGPTEAERIREETSDWGTRLHDVTAYSDLKKYKKMEEMIYKDESLLPSLLAWQEYVKEYIVKFVAIEKIVWSTKLLVAGTIDRVGIFKGDKTLSILDLKSGSLYDEIGIRLAGYSIMWNEMSTQRVKRYLAIHIPRKNPGHLQAKEYTKMSYEKEFEERCILYHSIYH